MRSAQRRRNVARNEARSMGLDRLGAADTSRRVELDLGFRRRKWQLVSADAPNH